MQYGQIISSSLGDVFVIAWYYFQHGGWVVLFIAAVFIVGQIYKDNITDAFVLSNKRIYFHIKIEKENLQSTLAVEQIFSSLHAMHSNFTWAEKYLEGIVNLWMSFEIVSLGGKISYIVSTPEKYKQLLESSFYSQYPNAEITQVEDYMSNLKHFDENSNWDLWGTEYKFIKDDAYPIKTWREFEHPAAEEPIIDPLTTLLEALSKCEPHELIAIQIVVRPIAEADWLPHSEKMVAELKEEGEHHVPLLERIIPPLGWIHKKTIVQAIKEGGKHGHGEEDGKQPKVMRMTEGERNIVKGIETKMTKPGWQTKIRHLYIAPRDNFDKNKKIAMTGAYRVFSTNTMNNLKPDIKGTWTNTQYSLLKNVEQPFLDFETEHKKHMLLEGFCNRSMRIGAKPMIMNCEELATLFHFPLATAATPPVERIEIKKGQPPANLPMA